MCLHHRGASHAALLADAAESGMFSSTLSELRIYRRAAGDPALGDEAALPLALILLDTVVLSLPAGSPPSAARWQTIRHACHGEPQSASDLGGSSACLCRLDRCRIMATLDMVADAAPAVALFALGDGLYAAEKPPAN